MLLIEERNLVVVVVMLNRHLLGTSDMQSLEINLRAKLCFLTFHEHLIIYLTTDCQENQNWEDLNGSHNVTGMIVMDCGGHFCLVV